MFKFSLIFTFVETSLGVLEDLCPWPMDLPRHFSLQVLGFGLVLENF